GDQTLCTLRGAQYRISGRESLAALAPLARVSGGRLLGDPALAAMQFGRAYGLAPQEATGLLGTMALMGREPTPNLASIRAVQAQANRAGIATLPTGAFAQGVGQTMQVGGTALLPMTGEEAARTNVFMGMFGSRYAATPAAAFAQYSAGLAGEKSPMGEVMTMQAMERQRQENPYITIGGRTFNLNRYTDMIAAREQMALPGGAPLQQKLFEEAERQAGGSEEDLRMNVQSAFGFGGMTQTIQAIDAFREARRRGGTFTGFMTQPTDVAAA